MTIDESYRFLQLVFNKEQRGNITPGQFNNLAPIAQIEAISDRLTNVKKIGERMIPQYGYKANKKIITELRLLLAGPIDMPVNSAMIADYPPDYFYPDAMFTNEYKRIEMVESDEYPEIKHSLIFPPDDEHPVAVFYGDFILVDPPDTTVKMTYIKYPVDPNWDYNMVGTTPVYNATATPGETGKVSQDFLGDRSFHLEICRKMLKYIGVNLDSQMVTEFAKMEEATGS